MKKTLGAVALTVGLALAPVSAMAGTGHHHSDTDAVVGVAAGAGVGALVGGPVGAIVGGVVGLIIVSH